MTSEVSRRILRGLGGKAFGQAAAILTRLAEVPLFLHFWGPQLYGEWLIIAALPTYLAMSDLGFAGAANRDMAMAVARGDRRAALSSFQSSSILILLLSAGLAGLFVVAMAMLPVAATFDLASVDRGTFLATIAILSAQIVFSSQTLLLFGGYYAEGRYPLGYMLLALIQYAQLAFLVAALALDAGILGVACAMGLAQALGCLMMRGVLARTAPWLRYGLGEASRATARRLLAPAVAGMAFPFGQAMSYQGVRLVIGYVLGPAAVAVFVTHRQLARMVSLVGSMVQPFQAELSAAYGAGDSDGFRRLSRRAFQIFGWAIIGCGLLILPVGAMLFEDWTRGAIDFEPALLGLLLIASAVEALWWIALSPLSATNRHVSIAGGYALVSIALAPLCYVGLQAAGLGGAAGAILAAEALMLALVLVGAMRITRDDFGPWLSFVARPPVDLLAAVGALRPGAAK